MRPDGSGVRPLSREGFNPSWSPDGTEVLYATIQTTASPYSNGARQSAVWAVNVQTGARRQILSSAAAAPQWSPHGHRIAYWAAKSISTCAPDGSASVTAVEASDGVYAWNPVWSPDGAYLYFSSNPNGPMHLWRIRIDERTGAVLERPEPAPVPMPSTFAAHVSFDTTGRRLLFVSAPLSATIQRVQFDMAAGEARGELTALTRGSRGWVWPEPSPDGTRLAFHPSLPDPEDIYVSAADGTHIHPLTEGMRARVGRWSPDGRRIAFYSGRNGQANIWIVGSDGRDLRQVTHSSAKPLIFPVWAPDGRMAASEGGPGGRSFIFRPDLTWDESSNLALLRDPEPDVQFVPWSWSADGNRLAGFTRRPSGIVVLSLATGAYTRFTNRGSTPVWLPDGRRLLYAVNDRLLLLDTSTGRSRELVSVGPARLELAAGGGFGLSSAGYIYLAPVTREGDIWLASAR
jgi:TolB protein